MLKLMVEPRYLLGCSNILNFNAILRARARVYLRRPNIWQYHIYIHILKEAMGYYHGSG